MAILFHGKKDFMIKGQTKKNPQLFSQARIILNE